MHVHTHAQTCKRKSFGNLIISELEKKSLFLLQAEEEKKKQENWSREVEASRSKAP